MTGSKYDISIGVQTTCTVDEAVARLLGWMQADKRSKSIRMAEHGISPDHLPYMISLEEQPIIFLSNRVAAAGDEYSKAFNANAKQEILNEIGNRVAYLHDEMKKAAGYVAAINNELGKRNSMLRINERATDREQHMCLYIGSLDRWAQKKYKSSVFQSPLIEPSSTNTVPDAKPIPIVEDSSKGSGMQSTAQAEPKVDEPLRIDGWGTVKADNVLTFIAFLIEEYCKIGPPKIRKGDKPNASGIGSHFEKLATAANNKNELHGLDAETIRKLVTQAQTAKIEKLKPKPKGSS